MGGKVSRLFADELEASIAFEKALKRQYGHDWDVNKYNVRDHDDATSAARQAHMRALSLWHQAAIGK